MHSIVLATRNVARAALMAWLLTACPGRELASVHPCVLSEVVYAVRNDPPAKVDLLFVVDNSGSMRQEQLALAEALPSMVRELASGDADGDGELDFSPVSDLHVGVVSTDMGTGSVHGGDGCEPGPGDDGLLQRGPASEPVQSRCPGSVPLSQDAPSLQYEPRAPVDEDRLERFEREVACIAQLGTGGCQYEQPLEASLKALTPSDSTLTFGNNSTGHGNGANYGFLRPDSLLAVVVVTNGDDCSAADPELYNPDSSVYTGAPELRCSQYERTALYPVRRYVDGLLALRDDPGQLVFAPIAGVPPDLVDDPEYPDLDAILSDERMQKHPDPSRPGRLDGSCEAVEAQTGESRGPVVPPRRLVRVARGIERRLGNALVPSICQTDLRPALDAVMGQIIANSLGSFPPCLVREFAPDSTGKLRCRMVETLPHPDHGGPTRCAEVPGRHRIGCDPEVQDCAQVEPTYERDAQTGERVSGEICEVRQLAVHRSADGSATRQDVQDGPGWYYDDFSRQVTSLCGEDDTDGQRIAFTEGAHPPRGTRTNLECLDAVPRGAPRRRSCGLERECTVGSFCDPDDDPCDHSPRFGDALVCDPKTRTCQLPCESNADCLEHNLGGFVCNRRAEDGNPKTRSPFAISACMSPRCGWSW
jgi:hypothetical protein